MAIAMKKVTKRSSRAKDQNATALLRVNPKLVGRLLAEYEKAGAPSEKKDLVVRIGTALNVDARVEEEVFYPALSAGAGGTRN